MKKVLILAALALSTSVFAHDEGHGPKLSDQPKQGGVVSPVVNAKDAKLGTKAALVHKAELVRSDDGSVKFYLYDKDMNALDLAKFGKTAEGFLAFKKAKKWTTTKFELKQEDGAYVAKPPKAGSKPFNIDVHVKEDGKELLAAFDNLD